MFLGLGSNGSTKNVDKLTITPIVEALAASSGSRVMLFANITLRKVPCVGLRVGLSGRSNLGYLGGSCGDNKIMVVVLLLLLVSTR
jgi:hypothetical protein